MAKLFCCDEEMSMEEKDKNDIRTYECNKCGERLVLNVIYGDLKE
ncbi:MAG: hypothetical protein ACFFCQ_07820 [Promethearchaeota archaeon]